MVPRCLLVALFCMLLQAAGLPGVADRADPPGSLRAVSLKVLQDLLRKSAPRADARHELDDLCGLTKVLGYVEDREHQDLLLIGEVDPQAPPLHTQDLVVALRNVWMEYASVQGNARYYSYPGCSIDPDPLVMRKLENIAGQIDGGARSGGVGAALKRWQATCGAPQSVRVIGVPRDTHFAKIMVDADYHMKRLVDGSISLNIPGFVSLVDATVSVAKRDILQNQPVSIPLSSMHRFWFCPGEVRCRQEEGIVVIDDCPVVLLTEQEHLQGETIQGVGTADPMAREFAGSFTACYDDIAAVEPIYQELQALFRFVALGAILRHNDAQIDLSYFIKQYRVPVTMVKDSLPGISSVKTFEHERALPNGKEEIQFWLPSCGGVSMDFNVTDSTFERDRGAGLTAMRDAALQARPSSPALSWDFRPGPGRWRFPDRLLLLM